MDTIDFSDSLDSSDASDASDASGPSSPGARATWLRCAGHAREKSGNGTDPCENAARRTGAPSSAPCRA